MSTLNTKLHVRNSSGYDDLILDSNSKTASFDTTGTTLVSTNAEDAIKEVNGIVLTAVQSVNVVNNLTTTTSGKVLDGRIGKTLDDKITLKANDTSSFTTAVTRVNIITGETISVILGKISKWFTDLKDGAFSSVVNVLTTTTTGTVLDGRAGKTLNDSITTLNDKLLANGTTTDNLLDIATTNPLNTSLKSGFYGLSSSTVGVLNLPENPFSGRVEIRVDSLTERTAIAYNTTTKKTWENNYVASAWSGWSDITLGSNKFLAYRQSFIGSKSYRFIWGKSNGAGYVRTNEISTPFLKSEFSIANTLLTAITIEGVGGVAIDYKSVGISDTGGIYLECSTVGASGMSSLVSNSCVASITIVLS